MPLALPLLQQAGTSTSRVDAARRPRARGAVGGLDADGVPAVTARRPPADDAVRALAVDAASDVERPAPRGVRRARVARRAGGGADGDAGLPEGAALRGPVAGALPAAGHATGRVLRYATVLLRESHRHGRGLPVHGGAAAARRSRWCRPTRPGRGPRRRWRRCGSWCGGWRFGEPERRAGVAARPVECRVDPAMERPATGGVLRAQHAPRCAHRRPRRGTRCWRASSTSTGPWRSRPTRSSRTRGTRNRFPSRMPQPISPSRSNRGEPAPSRQSDGRRRRPTANRPPGNVAPAAIQRRSVSICFSVSGSLSSGIWSSPSRPSTRRIIRLFSGSPGFTSAPLLPPFCSPSIESMRRRALTLSGPWHSTQVRLRIGMTSRVKSTASAACAAVAVGAAASGTAVQPRGWRRRLRRAARGPGRGGVFGRPAPREPSAWRPGRSTLPRRGRGRLAGTASVASAPSPARRPFAGSTAAHPSGSPHRRRVRRPGARSRSTTALGGQHETDVHRHGPRLARAPRHLPCYQRGHCRDHRNPAHHLMPFQSRRCLAGHRLVRGIQGAQAHRDQGTRHAECQTVCPSFGRHRPASDDMQHLDERGRRSAAQSGSAPPSGGAARAGASPTTARSRVGRGAVGRLPVAALPRAGRAGSRAGDGRVLRRWTSRDGWVA